MRWINKAVDSMFPGLAKSRRHSVRQMHAKGEAAPDDSGRATAAQLLDEGVVDVPEPPVDPEPTAGVVEREIPREAPREMPPEPDPMDPLLDSTAEGATPEAAMTPGVEPPERRTRERNINTDFLGVDNVDDIGRVLDANAASMGYGDEPAKSLGETRANVEGQQAKIFKEVLTEDPAALSDEQLLAGRDVLMTLVTRQEALARKIVDNKASSEELAQYDILADQAAMVQDYMQGKIRAAARALNSMKVVAQAVNTLDPQQVAKATQGTNIVNRAQTLLDMRAQGKSTGEVIKTQGEMSKAKRAAFSVVNLRTASILSGIRTQLVNIGGNLYHGAYQGIAVKLVAAAIGRARTNNASGADRVYANEVVGEIHGVLAGLGEALDIAASTWKHGTFTNQGEYISMYGGRKIDEVNDGADHVGTAVRDLFADTPKIGPAAGKAMDLSGATQALDAYHKAVEAVSFGTLTAADDAFKTIAYRSSLTAQAIREATRRGLSADEASKFVDEFMENPTNKAHQEAVRASEVRTFTNREQVGEAINQTANLVAKLGNSIPIIKWIFPVNRTPASVIDRSIKNSPLARLQDDYAERIAQGGVEADIARAEMAIGTSLFTIMAAMVSLGAVTGNGPARKDDPSGNVREGLKATGWIPNSIRTPEGKLISIKRGLDPSTLVPLALAQSVEAAMYAKDEADAWDYTAGTIFMIANQVAEIPFMQGMQDILRIVEGRSSGADWTARQVASMSPALARDVDAVFRFATGKEGHDYVPKSDDINIAMMLHLQAAAPFVDPPAVHRYWDGTVVTAGGGTMMFALNALTPVRGSWLYDSKGRAADPATAALVEGRVPVSTPKTKVVVDPDLGTEIDLLSIPNGVELYEQLRQDIGNQRRAAVESIVNTASYKQAREQNLTGPRSNYAMHLSQALTQGMTAGRDMFLARINSPDFDWTPYGGEESRMKLTGRQAQEAMQLRGVGVELEEDTEMLREQGVRGVPTRERIAPPAGGGSDVRKEYDPDVGGTVYVPNI